MSLAIRVSLVICALFLFAFVVWNIRKEKLRIGDSGFWLILSIVILVLAIFPGIASACSALFKFQAPINFVFLVFIAVLLVKCFRMSIHMSHLETKLEALAQQVAIIEKDSELQVDGDEVVANRD